MNLHFGSRWFRAWYFAGRFFAGGTATVFYSVSRVGDVVTVTVTTNLSDVLYYYWYLDGSYAGQTTEPTRSFQISTDDQFRLVCVPTADEDFDPIADAPAGFPSRRTIWWIRSLADDVASYRVEQKAGTDDWTTLATIPHDSTVWSYSVVTERLDDLTSYQWRVVPVDSDGNDGTAIAVDADTVVRWPDAPEFDATFDAETKQITFAAA